MYHQPLQHQPTWSSAQFAQVPKPHTLSTWASAPVIHTAHNGHAAGVSHPAPHHSFVPPAPPGVNPQQWQTGRWMYTAPPGGVSNAPPQGPYPPPNLAGWNIPAGWGVTPQYYFPPQKQAESSYWDTKLTNNGLGLEHMDIKQPVAHTAPGGKGKTPHTPWAWVPRELDDESPPPSSSSTQYRSALQSQQPSPVELSGRQNSTAASAAPAGGNTGYPGPGQAGQVSHAYFSIPADQQQQQHQQPSANTGSGSRPILPAATSYSAHIRQQSNPQQTATATHHQPPATAAAGSQSTSSTLPSQPTTGAQASQRSHGIAAPTPQRPGRLESYTSVKQLRPTFSPAIVRTPNHYRHDSQPVVPSPRVAPWDDASPNTNSAGVSTSANKHLSGARQGMVPSPRVFPWSAHARENDSGSPTPAPRHLRTSRTEPSRLYESSTRTVQRSYSIPEPPRPTIPVSRQNSMPTVASGPDSHHDHHLLASIGSLPQFAEEPDSVLSLSPLVGTEPSESSESSTSTTVHADSPQPLFIPPRYSRSPSPSPRHRRSRAVSPSSSSSPSSSDSEDSEDSDSRGGGPHHHAHRHRHHHHSSRRYRSPSHLHSQHRTSSGHQNNSSSHPSSGATYAGTPQGRSPASSTHTYRSSSSSNPLPTPPQERRDPGFSLPPPQVAKPPRGTYRRSLRYGYWNRRGDYLTMDKYVVYAPHDRANPPELENYPAPTEGYKDHYGNFVKYDPSLCELPESLPRQGLPPMLPYEKFVTYVYL